MNILILIAVTGWVVNCFPIIVNLLINTVSLSPLKISCFFTSTITKILMLEKLRFLPKEPHISTRASGESRKAYNLHGKLEQEALQKRCMGGEQ